MQALLFSLLRKSVVSLVAVILVALSVCPVMAQSEDIDFDLDDIESYLDTEERETSRSRQGKRLNEGGRKGSLQSLSDLAGLSTFSDIAVIQRRFLLKTGRFEGFLGSALLMNESFFTNIGGVLKVGYYFSEKWGIEGNLFILSSSEKDVTRSLAQRNVVTESLVTPNMYYGLDLKWVPIYGKMAFFNERIIPFDFYFTIGGGLTGIEQAGVSTTASTIKVGTGQMFAIRKWLNIRWDFSWHFFKPEVDPSATTNASGTSNNLFILLGLSSFFGGSS